MTYPVTSASGTGGAGASGGDATNRALLIAYEDALAEVEQAQSWAGHLEAEIMRRIREAGATGIPDEVYECILETRTEYDQGRLQPLLEALGTAELAAAYTPAHEEVKQVASKWDVRKLLPIAKLHGNDVLRVVEDAKFVGSQKLKFRRKE